MKRSALRRRRRRQIGSPALQLLFKVRALERARGVCPIADDGRHDGDLEAHHVVTQQALRRLYEGHIDDDALAAILWDDRNGLAVCGRHHRRHTLAIRRLPITAVPLDAILFATEHQLVHHIDRYYRSEGGSP